MKILHLIHTLRTCGGIERLLFLFLTHKSINPKEHIVAYITPGNYVPQLEQHGIKTIQISLVHPYDPRILWTISSLIKKKNPTLIKSWSHTLSMPALLAARWHKKLILCAIHGAVDIPTHNLIRRWWTKHFINYSARIITVTKFLKKTLRTMVPHYPSHKICVIYGGIPNSATLQKAELGLSNKTYVIGSVGRLHPIKRHDLLIEAFKHFERMVQDSHPDVKTALCIVGDGPERKTLETLAAGAQNIIFPGQQKNTRPFYNRFNCFALSSQSEGLSVSLMEAMVAGLPIVTTHHSRHHEALKHGVHGLLVPTNNATLFAKALYSVFIDKEKRVHMGIASKQQAEKQFSIDRMVTEYLQLFKRVIKETRAS